MSYSIITTKEFAISKEIVAEKLDGTRPEIIAEQSSANVELVDFEPWLATYLDPEVVYNISDVVFNSAVFLAEPPQEDENCQTFFDAVRALLLAGKLKNIAEDRLRSYAQVLEGELAYNETLVYEIVKTSEDNGTEPLQKIWIPNIDKLDLLRYIDTQVKYDKAYTYEIFAHQLIVGTEYTYLTTDLKASSVDFKVSYTPSLKIARISLMKKKTRVLDSAPLHPNVELLPYKGIPTQFLINLSANSGDYEADPIIINDADADFFEKYRESRNIPPGAPVRFKSDDPAGRFEVYRLSEPPKSYEDFKSNLLSYIGSGDVSSASMIDKIKSNTKYYYTFRTIDIHDNRSNPTPVYQVEIVENNGMMFFNTSIYQFPAIEDGGVATKTFRRYLKINPNLIQSLYNYEQSIGDALSPESAFSVDKVVLGRAEKSVWDKKFKIRVTSKHTGRKFDINLQCNVNYNKMDKPTS